MFGKIDVMMNGYVENGVFNGMVNGVYGVE